MTLAVERDRLLAPLAAVAPVVESRATLPILANVLLKVDGQQLTLTGTDLEIELTGHQQLDTPYEQVAVTIPARKFFDICRALPEDASIKLNFQDDKLILQSGRSRFALATLPAKDFPTLPQESMVHSFDIHAKALLSLLSHTSFAMAQQDVRYFLNAVFFDITEQSIKAVASDGHRLALSTYNAEQSRFVDAHALIPRKAVLELVRLLNQVDDSVTVKLSEQSMAVIGPGFNFSTKLIEGRFPGYQKAIPQGGDKTLVLEKDTLKQLVSRAAILSNEQFRGVRFNLSPGALQIMANNPEQEQAEEEWAVEYDDEPLVIAFNVNYLLDVCQVIDGEHIQFTFKDAMSSVLIEAVGDERHTYVLMPMRL